MTMNSRPRRALVAYCALAERLNMPGVGYMQALTPFLAQACISLQEKLFDAQEFSNEVNSLYGIHIPKLAALGMAGQLEKDGVLEEISTGRSGPSVYKYKKITTLENGGVLPVTVPEIEKILAAFVSSCLSDDVLKSLNDDELQAEFLDRLLNVDSMRILSRREGSAAVKKSSNTLIATQGNLTDGQDRVGLHLDYHVSQFLLDLAENSKQEFELVSNIAFANMAAEAIACFREPNENQKSIKELTVYFDSPLLLDILGVNPEYAEYGRELLESIKLSGAKPATFDDCIVEAENVVSSRLHSSTVGINKTTSSFGYGAASNSLLSAISKRVAKTLEIKGIEIDPNPSQELHKRYPGVVGDIEALLKEKMQGWRNDEAKSHDQNSVWALLKKRNTATRCTSICDSEFLFLTRNTPLVAIANKAWQIWLKGTTKHGHTVIEDWAPISMSDKQFAGYLWARSGGGDGKISKIRLLAHCSSAIKPRADIKAKTYNLVLDLYGKEEAETFEALLTDREGVHALMRATNGDLEDATAERMPLIMERMKIAAGEFAAHQVRQEAEQVLQEKELAYKQELKQLIEKKAFEEERLMQINDQTQQCLNEETKQRKEIEDKYRVHQQWVLATAFNKGRFVYSFLRWSVVILATAVAGVAAWVSTNPDYAYLATFLTSAVVFTMSWFVPSYLNRPFHKLAMCALWWKVKKMGGVDKLPSCDPDFEKKTWIDQKINLEINISS